MPHTNNKEEKPDLRLEAVRFWEEKFPTEYKEIIERVGEVSILLGSDKGKELADSIKNTITALHQELQKCRESERELWLKANDILRSCNSVIQREGKDTNWEPLKKTVLLELERQHELLKPIRLSELDQPNNK